MGSTQALGFAEAVGDGQVSLEAALHYHLFTNHFPPLPQGSTDIAVQALNHAALEEWDETIDFSSVSKHRIHGTQVPTHAIIEAWHLAPFIGVTAALLDKEE